TALNQSDLDALKSALVTYKSMSAQFTAMKPGPLGVTATGAQANTLITRELPALLDSITRKSNEVMAAAATTVTAPSTVGEPSLQAAANLAPFDGPTFKNFWDEAYAVFKDLRGVAIQNIIELAASLANDLINIAAVSLINEGSTGEVVVDIVAAG